MQSVRCPNCGGIAEIIERPEGERYYEVLVVHDVPTCPIRIRSYHHTSEEALSMFRRLLSDRKSATK